MNRQPVFLMILMLFLVSISSRTLRVEGVEASGTIYIRAHGSIDPPTAPISTADNVTYAFTGDINDSIVIERDNIVVDGAGYTVEGTGSGSGIGLSDRINVTIKNMTIKAFGQGIALSHYSNYNTISGNNITTNYGLGYSLYVVNSLGNSISGNNISNNRGGIGFYNSVGNSISGNNIIANIAFGISFQYYSSNNTISGNNIKNNEIGIGLDSSCNNNTIYHNNFMNNSSQVGFSSGSNVWDDGSRGNYWSDYLTKYPNATEIDSSGVWNTPYIVDTNNTDHYPLTVQYVIPEFPSFLVLPLSMMATLLAVAIYRMKHRQTDRIKLYPQTTHTHQRALRTSFLFCISP